MNQWWKCPKCGSKVDFTRQMFDVFDFEDGEANFAMDRNCGLYFHTIMCSCGANWVVSISGMYDEEN